MKKRILILFAHPALEKSRVNKLLIEGMDTMEGITFHDLYQAYPEFDIDVQREQALMEEHDIIVFHHPFYWYSTPAIIKEYLDLVFEHGYSFNPHTESNSGHNDIDFLVGNLFGVDWT